MKIQRPQPTNEATAVFVDREVQQSEFMKHLLKIKASGVGDGLLLIYSGVGGIGKTLLFDQFKKMAGESKKNFVLHDFKSNTDMVAVLKTLRKNLSDLYRMEFPLFDKGCIYLAQKSGEFVSNEQKKKILMDTAAFRWFRKNLFLALNGFALTNANDYVTLVDKLTDKISDTIGESAAEDLKNFLLDAVDASAYLKSSTLSFVEYVQKIFSGSVEFFILVKAFKPILNFVERRIQKADEKERAKGNERYGELLIELEDGNMEDDPAHVKELLPKLFAQDLSHCLEEFQTDLIVFLDTYEVLTGEELGKKKYVRLISENRDVPVDWWVGELLVASRVMWVIASRYEITEIGEIPIKNIDDVENYTVDVLEKNWANKCLERLEVKEENLRKGIVKLTGGHPLYLIACSVTYHNLIEAGKIPRMSDFGKDKDKIIKRALGSFDESTLFLLQKLCILGSWTDELANFVISDFNPNTYKRLIDLFAEKTDPGTNYEEFVVYNFNRTIAAFLLPGLKQDVLFAPVFTKIRDGANDFFQKFFAENRREDYDDEIKAEVYFSMWSEIILRTTDVPEELMTLYSENLAPSEKFLDLSTQATCAEKFLNKVGDTETLPSAYFQHCLGVTRFFQDMSKEGLELEQAAYSKLQRLPLDDETRPLKIFVTIWLANIFRRLKRYTDEINLRKEIVAEGESYYPDADDERILDAKENLARALEYGDRIDEAIKIRRQIVELLDGHDDEIFISALKNLAAALETNNQYEETVSVRKKIADVCEKLHDDEQLIDALRQLSFTLDEISGDEALEEKLTCYQKILRLHETNGREVPADLITFIADVLNELDRKDEAAQTYKNFVDELKRHIEARDKPDEKTFKLMASMVKVLDLSAQFEECALWKEKTTADVENLVAEIREPVGNYDAVISMLKKYSSCLGDEFFYKAQVALWRKILALTEKNPAGVDREIIAAKKILTNHLRKAVKFNFEDEYIAEELRLFDDVTAYYKKIFPKNFDVFTDKFLPEQIRFLELDLHDLPAVVAKLTEILDFLEKHPKATAYQIFCFMDNIALEFYLAQKYSEAVLWRERMLNFCQNNFMDDSPEVSRTLRFLNLAYIKLKAYDKAEPSLKAELAILEKKLTASHRKVIEVKENLADTFHEMKKFDDELRLREQIVELWRENFAANEANKNFLNQEFAQAQEKLASLLDLLGEKERAKDIRSQINYAPDEDDLEALFEEFENLDESQRAKEMRDFEKIKQKCD